ncbi:MAG TPA: polysaccharide biosynthesis/export family protein [Methylomirabilota bacterium]|jgi:polysaccharide export outer membrane protein|nr:polysaccharide biosynthesis/export family protein [Methylomirabilota bacterium]
MPLTPVGGGPISTDPGTNQLNARLLSFTSAPVDLQDLPLGPGDLIEVSVFEVPELSKLQVRVPLNGSITFPLLGTIQIVGQTAVQVQQEIARRLQQKYMHDPQVSVSVVEQKGQRISVLGAVRKGGVFTFTGPIRLADALAMAEGLTENADHQVYLTRRVPVGTLATLQDDKRPAKDEKRPAKDDKRPARPSRAPGGLEQVMVTIDLDELAKGNEDLNVPLQPGDVVTVPPAGSFYVGGEVEKPGTFLLKPRTTLDQAIIVAGGLRDVADWSDVRIYRTLPGGKQEIHQYDMVKIQEGERPPEIQKSDVILVGKSGGKAFGYGVLGFFQRIFSVGVGVSRGL